jgi:hypothetical protein
MISFGLKEKTGDVYVHWFRVGSSKKTYYHSGFDNVGTGCVLAGAEL